jgi:hypothetical protein
MTPADSEPSCGKCGYCVVGLQSFTCPECGSDLREVGIVTARARHIPPRILAATIWTVFLALMAILASHLLVDFILPTERMQMVRREIFCQLPQFNVTIEVMQYGTRYAAGVQSRFAIPLEQMNIHILGTMPRLYIDLKTGAWTEDFKKPRISNPPFGEPVLINWLRARGVAVNDPAIQQAANDIMICLRQSPVQSAQFTQFRVNSPIPNVTAHPAFAWNSQFMPGWEEVGLVCGWAALWMTGLFAIWRANGVRKSSAGLFRPGIPLADPSCGENVAAIDGVGPPRHPPL